MFDLTKKTDYGLQLMTALARGYKKGPISLRKIAKDHRLPLKFLEQVAADLRQQRFIDAKEGKGGGYFLKKPPSKIPLSKVINVLEGPVQMGGCLGCPKSRNCGQRNVWSAVGRSVKKTIGKKTLEDLM